MYPKTLYCNGAYTVVKGETQEAEAKRNGFFDPSTVRVVQYTPVVNVAEPINETKRRGRPRRVAQ